MKVSLTAAIVHVPTDRRRVQWVKQITERLEDIPVQVFEDRTHAGPWTTAQRAFTWLAQAPTSHTLILADDMMPCPDFRRIVVEAIEAVPYEMISLFDWSPVLKKVADRGEHWYIKEGHAFSMSQVMPIDGARQFLSWCRHHVAEDCPWEDIAMSLYFKYGWGKDVWVTAPTLVEHVGALYSLQAHNFNKQQSKCYMGRDFRGEIDWTPPKKPYRPNPYWMAKTLSYYLP